MIAYKRRYKAIPIFALLLMILFKFQNCAPVSQMAVGSTLPNQNANPQQGIIDNFNVQKVSFLNNNWIVLQDSQGLNLQGLCIGSSKGQLIEYQVIELGDIPKAVLENSVECNGGGFEILLSQVHFSSCKSSWQIRAIRKGDPSQYAEAILNPDCVN